ncbi:OsmC family protein [Flavobacterium sp.]|uniref:OsmC family protein n=1 Tax=Flavobacterium sp. TaxID=239 RepID=UPI00263594E2|nr:OsmC family protein [Flavobacterium sp.]MDD3005568.1 OsmC family protein [Flavobacterium sp.]
MSQEHFYQVDLKWKEGRIGELSSPVLDNTIECATPPEFSNGVPNIWSPEHLYAASINSCFMATFLAIAENFKVEFESFECKTNIKLELIDRKYLITEAELLPKVKLKDSEQKDKALRVIEKSKENCLVTNSMKTEVIINPEIL